jgi:hypothetical protein
VAPRQVDHDRHRRILDFEAHPVALAMHPPVDQVHGRVADQRRDEVGGRLVVDFLRRADLLDPPLAQDQDAVGERQRLAEVVGDVERRGADRDRQLLEARPGLELQLGVQVRQRLVQQEHVGLAHHRPRERDALALAAGELAGQAVQIGLDAEDSGDMGHLLPLLGR